MVKCTLQKTGWLMGGHHDTQRCKSLASYGMTTDGDGRTRTDADGMSNNSSSRVGGGEGMKAMSE